MRPQAAAMKALLDRPEMQLMPGCGDGLGARLIQEAGLKTAFASGSCVHAQQLAMPDMDLVSFPEMRDAVAGMIAAAPKVFWLADGDTGHGNALAVQRTVREMARAGAAAVLIEDKAWPRPLGRNGAKLVVERDEALSRIRVAIQAAHEEGILLLARTDACTSRGFPEALARLEAFVADGADIFFLDSPQDASQLQASIAACRGKPAMSVTVQGGKHYMPDDATLARAGVKIANYPQAMLVAAVHAMRAALAGLKGEGPQPAAATPAEMASAIRLPEYLAEDARLAGK